MKQFIIFFTFLVATTHMTTFAMKRKMHDGETSAAKRQRTGDYTHEETPDVSMAPNNTSSTTGTTSQFSYEENKEAENKHHQTPVIKTSNDSFVKFNVRMKDFHFDARIILLGEAIWYYTREGFTPYKPFDHFPFSPSDRCNSEIINIIGHPTTGILVCIGRQQSTGDYFIFRIDPNKPSQPPTILKAFDKTLTGIACIGWHENDLLIWLKQNGHEHICTLREALSSDADTLYIKQIIFSLSHPTVSRIIPSPDGKRLIVIWQSVEKNEHYMLMMHKKGATYQRLQEFEAHKGINAGNCTWIDDNTFVYVNTKAEKYLYSCQDTEHFELHSARQAPQEIQALIKR